MADNNIEKPYEYIGKHLKAARTAAGLSQDEMAKKTGVSRHHIVNIETGERCCDVDLLLKYSEILGQSPDEILDHKTPSILPELAALISSSSQGNQRKLLEVFRLLDRLYVSDEE